MLLLATKLYHHSDIIGVASLGQDESPITSIAPSSDRRKQPTAGLVLASDGNFYGVTCAGGASVGTFYSWDGEFPAFIKLVSTTGTVGTSIGILGQGFTGTTSVTFNGVSASFSVSLEPFTVT